MGFISKFTNWASNKAQGISNKLGNMWHSVKDTASNAYDKAKGVASKVWEGTKTAAKAAGKFIYDNSDAIAAGLGGLAAGAAAAYGVDPGTILAARETLGGIANALPEGKVKSALLSAAWKSKRSPQAEAPKLNLTQVVPGGKEYSQSVAGRDIPHGGEFKHLSNAGQYYVPDITTVIRNVKKPSNKKKMHL